MIAVMLGTDLTIGTKDLSKPLYSAMRKAVGGNMEVVHPRGLPKPFCLIVNRVGRLLELPPNLIGSLLYGAQTHGRAIVGNALIMKSGVMTEGTELAGLTTNEAALIQHWLKREYPLLMDAEEKEENICEIDRKRNREKRHYGMPS